MKKILVVEDDPDIARALSIRLKSAGYEVIMAFDAVMGTTAAVQRRPDLAILDISMPGGNGIMLAQRLQTNAETIGTPVIFITASKKPELRLEAEEIGAVGFFEKPYEADEVIGLINRTLGQVQPSR